MLLLPLQQKTYTQKLCLLVTAAHLSTIVTGKLCRHFSYLSSWCNSWVKSKVVC